MTNSLAHKIIFLHVEKAGGSTLHNIFTNYYEPSQILHLEYMRTGQEEISRADLNALKIIKGHNIFGAHRYAGNDWKYYSMLREPHARVISYFYYVRQKESHHHSELIRKKNWSMGTYITEARNLQMDNGQVRYISGSQKEFGAINREDLDLAKDNIDRMFLDVGLMERFDESLVILKNALGWSAQPVYERANVNRNKEKSLNENDIKQIHEFNKYDAELYKFVKERFERQASGEKVRYELKRLTRAIKWYYFKKNITGLLYKNKVL